MEIGRSTKVEYGDRHDQSYNNFYKQSETIPHRFNQVQRHFTRLPPQEYNLTALTGHRSTIL